MKSAVDSFVPAPIRMFVPVLFTYVRVVLKTEFPFKYRINELDDLFITMAICTHISWNSAPKLLYTDPPFHPPIVEPGPVKNSKLLFGAMYINHPLSVPREDASAWYRPLVALGLIQKAIVKLSGENLPLLLISK